MIYEWLQGIEFKYPWVFVVAAAVPLLLWLRHRLPLKSALTVTAAAAFTRRTAKNTLVHLPLWLRTASLLLLITALARPQIKNRQTKTTGEGIAIMLCMDVSGSMLSRDFYPNRLEVAKELAAEFVRQRPVDQIGLVVFAGEAFTQYPLTTDHQSLVQQIEAIRSGVLEDGTLIGEGLATAVQRIASVQAKSKVVVLLTDGREEAPDTRIIDPTAALEITKAKGVKVYTIGMGSEGAVAVDERTGKVAANTAFIDETLLRRIAAQTRGAYFRATNKEGLGAIYDQIDRLEKSNVEVINRTKYTEVFFPFVAGALLLLVLEMILRYSYLRTLP